MWGVSIRTPKETRMLIRSGFTEAKALGKKAKEKFKDHDHVTVELVSRKKVFPPPFGYTPTRSRFWCPYCAKERIFYRDRDLDLQRCVVCDASTNLFWVRTYNRIWGKDSK